MENMYFGLMDKENCKFMDAKNNLPIGKDMTITKDLVYKILDSSNIKSLNIDGKTTMLHCELPNGFVITETSSCVNPANFSMETGAKICMEKIENRLWELLGFLLASCCNGFDLND